jgi:HK97 family phage prohead protease
MKFISTSRFRELAEQGDSHGTGVSRLARVIRAADDGTRTVRFILSDASVDRMGDSINAAGWQLDSYRRNPVVLWAHDSSSPPIGRMTNIFVANEKLMGDVQFAPVSAYPFAETIYNLVTEGFIKAGSVGFIPIEWKFADDKSRPMGIDFKRQELLEFSVVPVPANANALIEARSYRGSREPTLAELGAQLGRAIVAARLRNALPPPRYSREQMEAIVAALRRAH